MEERIIGIDPGSRYTGYGIIEKQGTKLKHIASGVITTVKIPDLADTVYAIHEQLQSILETYQPNILAVEKVFHSVNAHSSLVLGHVRGVILLAAKQANVTLLSFSPTAIKSATVGTGRAEKKQVAYMVSILLNLRSEPLKEDQADALAVAICAANTQTYTTLS